MTLGVTDDQNYVNIANALREMGSGAEDLAFTPGEIPAAIRGLRSIWGTIEGSILDQTDLQNALNGKANANHDHDSRYYTESEIDTKLNGKSNTGHTHDDRYYTESEIDTKLNGKSNIDHTHDERYYTETEIDDKFDENTIIKSVSGAIASFDDGVEAPAGNVTVAIEPVQEGIGDPSPDNVRPITGWTGVNVMRTGKNLFSEATVGYLSGSTEQNNFGVFNANAGKGTFFIGKIEHGKTYTIKSYYFSGISRFRIGLFKNYPKFNKNHPYGTVAQPVSEPNPTEDRTYTFTNTDYNWVVLSVRISTEDFIPTAQAQLEESPSATTYEAPHTAVTIPFGDTVYGGSLDVMSGKLTVDRASVTLDENNNWSYSVEGTGDNRVVCNDAFTNFYTLDGTAARSKCLCNRGVYSLIGTSGFGTCFIGKSSGKFYYYVSSDISNLQEFLAWVANNPLQVSYRLATPLTYQLTPAQVTTLLGQNNIWADTGNIDVSYFTEAGEDIGKAFDNVSKSSKYDDDKTREMLTQSSELEMTASKNYTAGNLIIINDKLLRATANIASGGAITIGTNAEEVDLETIIAEKAEKILVAKLPFLSSAELYNNTADFHNAIPRGKDITAYLTDGTLWKRINGTNGFSLFEDLYVGDTITAGGQQYVIVDFDYYIRSGSVDITEHHLVMMPAGKMKIPAGTILYGSSETLVYINTANAGVTVDAQEGENDKKWNATMEAPNTNSINGGYKYSRMRQVIMRAADTIVINAFGSTHVKPITVWYPNPADASASGLASNAVWFANDDWTQPDRKSICDLPNETQIYGQQVWGRGSDYKYMPYEVGIDKWQFSLFKVNRSMVNIHAPWWLRSVSSDRGIATNVNTAGIASSYNTSSSFGVRPRFVLVG